MSTVESGDNVLQVTNRHNVQSANTLGGYASRNLLCYDFADIQ